MSTKRPRYYVQPDSGRWLVVDRMAPDGSEDQVLAELRSEQAARTVCEGLNRGLCETVAPNGRWTTPVKPPEAA